MEVGILDDKPHKDPLAETTTYAGGPVRKTGRQSSDQTTGDVLISNMERLGINLLSDPFQNEKSTDILRFTQTFLKMALSNGKVGQKRVENLLQAIVRNPILRQQYGSNDLLTQIHKGFNRHLFDTGQMFKAIKARAKRVKK